MSADHLSDTTEPIVYVLDKHDTIHEATEYDEWRYRIFSTITPTISPKVQFLPGTYATREEAKRVRDGIRSQATPITDTPQ